MNVDRVKKKSQESYKKIRRGKNGRKKKRKIGEYRRNQRKDVIRKGQEVVTHTSSTFLECIKCFCETQPQNQSHQLSFSFSFSLSLSDSTALWG